MQVGTWAGTLSQDQTLRASALIGLYQKWHIYLRADLADAWVALANRGPLFCGTAPVDVMVAAEPARLEGLTSRRLTRLIP